MPAAASSPIHSVVDQLVDLVDEFVPPTQLLIPALASVVDPRHRRGIRHRPPGLLALSVCAVIAGARSFVAIAQWAADLPPHLLGGLGRRRYRAVGSAFRRTLQRLDADHLDRILGWWAAGRIGGCRGLRAVAVDGKSVRGARTGTDRCPHLLAAITHMDGLVLGQVDVDVKTNEIPMLPILLETIDLTRTIVTADALHCQKTHATYLVDLHAAHYLLTVLGEPAGAAQPTRRAALGRRSDRSLRRREGHGRIEERTLKAVTVTAGTAFPHLQITRRTRKPRTSK